MNKLSKTKCYLCGPIDRTLDGGVEWRRKISVPLKKFGVIILDPTNKNTEEDFESEEHRKRRSILKMTNRFDELSNIMKEIRSIDLRCVDISDFLVVNWNVTIHTVGTMEEVTLANRQKKPILVHCEQGIHNMPDWLFGMLPHKLFFDEWENMMDYLTQINNGEEDVTGRWKFFIM